MNYEGERGEGNLAGSRFSSLGGGREISNGQALLDSPSGAKIQQCLRLEQHIHSSGSWKAIP